jgi:polygalacturonase
MKNTLIAILCILPFSWAIGQTVNVRDYGAQGDGAANDSASFQQAIRDASSRGATLLVPAGTYLIANLLMYPGVKIKGEGAASILRLSPSSTGAPRRSCLVYDRSSSGVSLEGLYLDANGANNSGKNAFCVFTNLTPGAIHDLTFTNCTFTGSKGYGAVFLIGTAGSIQNVRITGCRFFNTGSAGMHLRGVTGMVFSGNTLNSWAQLDPQNPAVTFESQECSAIRFTHNTFTNTTADHFAIECAGAFVRNSQFLYNTFDGNGRDAAGISGYYSHCLFQGNRTLRGGGDHRSGYELVGDDDTVCNGYLDNANITLGTTPPFGTEKGGNGYLICSDTVINHAQNGMCLGLGGADTVRNATIVNNIFDNRAAQGSAPAIVLGARGFVRNILVQGNTLYGSGTSSCIRFKISTGGANFRIDPSSYQSGGVSIVKNSFVGPKGVKIDNPANWQGVEFKDNDFTKVSDKAFEDNNLTPDIKMTRNHMRPSGQ